MGLFAAAMVSIIVILLLNRAPHARKDAGRAGQTLVILLQNNRVTDSTPDVEQLLGQALPPNTDWSDLHGQLKQRFPDLPEDLPDHPLSLASANDADITLNLQRTGNLTRITITTPPQTTGRIHQLITTEAESKRVAALMEANPHPVWQKDLDGRVIWTNPAYDALLEQALVQNPTGCLFAEAISRRSDGETLRACVENQDGDKHWYEITSIEDGDITTHFATSINVLINAEMAQRNFVQTLTKTFAHLPIGLAVFDRDRRLVLFNPALVDLTHLPIDFLSAKPNLLSFFDHMRENRMMPEPKSYSSWRDKLYEVVSAAREDRYCETWNLPSGLTYKITGRPHPDGAVAFLIEDISAEISLTRRFRSELDLTQSVIECFDTAVVVFSRLGVKTYCNAAYHKLWGVPANTGTGEITIIDTSLVWQGACKPNAAWSELRDYVLTLQNRKAWNVEIETKEGVRLMCRIEPVSSGATLVRFDVLSTATPAIANEMASTELA
ncbi:MAG: PAS-domain containing protein [Pelagimonas sp.]|nr:PAS-domain containing protein [Pelagimonas sp.]